MGRTDTRMLTMDNNLGKYQSIPELLQEVAQNQRFPFRVILGFVPLCL